MPNIYIKTCVTYTYTTAHAPITIQRSVIFLFFFFVQRWHCALTQSCTFELRMLYYNTLLLQDRENQNGRI